VSPLDNPLGATGIAMILVALFWIGVDWYNDR
jgi:hypothetical protein